MRSWAMQQTCLNILILSHFAVLKALIYDAYQKFYQGIRKSHFMGLFLF